MTTGEARGLRDGLRTARCEGLTVDATDGTSKRARRAASAGPGGEPLQ